MDNRNLTKLRTIANACNATSCEGGDSNGDYIDELAMLAEAGQLSGGDGTITVDSALSTTSINPVQNRVIAKLIPSEANASNQLADKAYVDNAVVNADVSNKVDKEDGKGLSTNDFTNEDKAKLDSLENYDDTLLVNELNNKVNKEYGKGLSTNDFTNEYKTKLDTLISPDVAGLESLIATKADLSHTHDDYLTINDIDNKVDKVDGKGLSTNDYTDEDKAKLESLSTFGETFNNSLNNKVDKELGKGLSTNDFNDEYKSKLEGLSNFNDADLRDLIATKADAVHTHTEYAEKVELDRKVDKEDGKGLSTNDYTNEEKTKLGSLENYDDTGLQDRISVIESKIPVEASETNQLADKEFVNSSIATATADFIGTFSSVEELNAYAGEFNKNDYAFVHGIDAVGNQNYNRYKWNGEEWLFEYLLNNSSFTAEQWANINGTKGKTYTTLAELGLTADATFQDVVDALPKGGSALLGVTEFTNYQTIFPYEEGNDQFARVHIVKGTADGSRMYARWFRKDGVKEAIAIFNINDNKFDGWRVLKDPRVYTSLKELELDTTATINDIIGAMKDGSQITYKTDVFDYATEYNNIQLGTVVIHKQSASRVQALMTDKDTGSLYVGRLDGNNKVIGWRKIITEVSDPYSCTKYTALTGTEDLFTLPCGHYVSANINTTYNYPVTDSSNATAHIYVLGCLNDPANNKGYRIILYFDNKGRMYRINEWWGSFSNGWQNIASKSIYNSIAELNRTKGTSITLVNGEDNTQKIVDALSVGEQFVSFYHNNANQNRFGIDASYGNLIHEIRITKCLDADLTANYATVTAFMNTGCVMSRIYYKTYSTAWSSTKDYVESLLANS